MPLLRRKWFLKGDASRWLRRNRTLVVLACAAAVIGGSQLPLMRRFIPILKLEQAMVDFRFRLRGDVAASPDVAIIGINATSLQPGSFDPKDVAGSEALQWMRQPFPWNRKVYALLLDKLMAAGAKAVVLDLLFLNPADGDEDFAAALRKYGDRVVIGSAFMAEDPYATWSKQIYRRPEPKLSSATKEKITGCVNLPVELDGVIRRTWYWTSDFAEYGVADDSRDIISMAGMGVTKFNPQPNLPEGTSYINFQGPAATYLQLPIEEVFSDKMFNAPWPFENGKVFRNKLVFVGAVAETLHDMQNTPYGLMPGVEIHAQIAGSLLKGTTLRNPPGWLAAVLTVAMGLAAAAVSLRTARALALGGLLGGGLVLFVGAAQWAFVGGNMLIPMAMPLLVFCGIGLFGLVFKFVLEQMERARVRSVLDRYVSRNVAELVLTESDEFEKALLGQRRWVTALFSDIRGFTTMTEGSVPEELVEQLNEYFYKMVDAVLAADGTLQQFIGDAIMAIWGNTHTLEPAAGAYQAVRTALAMQAALAELNARWAGNPSRRQYRIGIGVNHGEVIVGSLGHPRRMEFTTIGDGINTAARLETATQYFGGVILVGEAVESLTRDKFHYRRVGLIRFKGKTKAIEVYTPLGERGAALPGWVEGYHGAIGLYRQREFERAEAAFEAASAEMGGEDCLCEMYLKRCREYIAAAPAADWDGAWTLTEK